MLPEVKPNSYVYGYTEENLFGGPVAIAGAAGTLYSLNCSTITANKFDFNTSILVLVFVVLGSVKNNGGTNDVLTQSRGER